MEAPIHVPHGQDDDDERRPSALTKPEVSIVVVSYNTRDFLRRCLESVKGSQPERAYEVIVVDNDSADGSADAVEAEFPEARLLRNGENVGYSRAVNQAIQTAHGKYVLILNPDIEVLTGAIDELARHLDENPGTGIAGGKLLNPDGTLQYSCRTFYTFSTLLHRRTPIGKLFPNSRVVRDHLMMDWDHESVREVDWMLGACMMVRKDAIEDVGLMDERFFMYFEDVDWCYRMKTHGWKVVYVPAARMTHVHRRDSAKHGIFSSRLLAHLNSMFRFFDKWNTLAYRARKHRDLLLGVLHFTGDVVAINLSFLGAHTMRSLLQSILQRPVFPLSAYEPFLLLVNAVVLFMNAMLGLYGRASSRDPLDDAIDLAKGLVLSMLILMASTFLTRSELHSRLIVGTFVVFAFATMVTGRVVLGALGRKLRESRFDLIRVVVLGSRDAAEELAAGLEERPELGFEVVAALSDRPAEGERRFREFFDAEGIRELIRRHRVGEVLLVRPTLSDRELSRLVLLCRRDGIRVRLVSGAADFLPGHATISEMLGHPVVDLSPRSGRPVARKLHRALDALGAALALLLLGPLGWKQALRGPRESDPHELVTGFRGKSFRRGRAEGGRWSRLAEDLGHVLRGELALVGPRPHPPREVESSEELGVLFDLVRPGVTGPWRIHRGTRLSVEEEVSLSLSYLQNQTPLSDLKIVLKTLAPNWIHPDSKRSDS